MKPFFCFEKMSILPGGPAGEDGVLAINLQQSHGTFGVTNQGLVDDKPRGFGGYSCATVTFSS